MSRSTMEVKKNQNKKLSHSLKILTILSLDTAPQFKL